MHGSQDILLGGLAHRILLIIGQNDHVLSLVAEVLCQVSRHVSDVVNTTSELTALAKVVDADKKSFPAPGTVGIPEGIALRRTRTKMDGFIRRRGRHIGLPRVVGIGGHSCGISQRQIWGKARFRLRRLSYDIPGREL